jgi:hypothetical protein
MGRKLANRDVIDWLRKPSKRPERFILDVIASSGILIPDMIVEDVGGCLERSTKRAAISLVQRFLGVMWPLKETRHGEKRRRTVVRKSWECCPVDCYMGAGCGFVEGSVRILSRVESFGAGAQTGRRCPVPILGSGCATEIGLYIPDAAPHVASGHVGGKVAGQLEERGITKDIKYGATSYFNRTPLAPLGL